MERYTKQSGSRKRLLKNAPPMPRMFDIITTTVQTWKISTVTGWPTEEEQAQTKTGLKQTKLLSMQKRTKKKNMRMQEE